MYGSDILLFGTMGNIGPVMLDSLRSGHGLDVNLVEFAQNTFRDFWGYGRGLGKAVETFRPRVIFPIGDSLALARLKEQYGYNAAVASSSSVELLNSKVRTYSLASELGIRQPAVFRLDNLPALVACEESPGLIFKRDISFGGSGVHRPRTIESLRNMVGRQNGAPYLIEEYIEGEDLSIDCVRGTGFFRAECYICQSRYSQGPSDTRIRTQCPQAEEIARKILDAVDYYGVCGMDFKLSHNGLFFLECNPRFTGGIKTQIESGFDIPYILFGMFRPQD